MPIVPEVRFTKAARRDIIKAQDWYEDELLGLGGRFRAEVDATVKRIHSGPLQFPVIQSRTRRVLLRHFPYSLMFYVDVSGDVLVIACFHASRSPAVWQRRQ